MHDHNLPREDSGIGSIHKGGKASQTGNRQSCFKHNCTWEVYGARHCIVGALEYKFVDW